MLESFLLVLLVSLVCESLTELAVKSEIFEPIREVFSSRPGSKVFTFIYKALTCGYCFSVWVSIFLNIVLAVGNTYLIYLYFLSFPVIIVKLLSFFISVIIVHRLSNFIHGLGDRYFSTKKDNRYNSML